MIDYTRYIIYIQFTGFYYKFICFTSHFVMVNMNWVSIMLNLEIPVKSHTHSGLIRTVKQEK